MKYELTKPCDNCPFVYTKPFPLKRARVEEIIDGLLHKDIPFSCHKTTTQKGRDCSHKNSQHCAGALIFLEKQERPHQAMRIGERIGLYDMRKLDMDAPVYDDADGMIDSYAGAIGD